MNQAIRQMEANPLSIEKRPFVSVIIPCYNYAHWLRGCVESVIQQAGVDVEIVIVNDASTDDSSRVAQLLAENDSRIKVIEHTKNLGHIPSVNEALECIRGDYIVKLDADDLLSPGSLVRSVALLEAHPTVGFVYGRALYFGHQVDENMSLSHRWLRRGTYISTDSPPVKSLDLNVRSWTVWPGVRWIELMCARGANCISQPEVVVRTRTLRSVGRYDEALPHTSDLAMWLALASVSDVGHVDGAIQGLYRVHSSSMQRTVNAGKVRDLRGRVEAFLSVLQNPLRPVDSNNYLTETVLRRLSAEALEEACRAYDRGRTATESVDAYVAFAQQTYREYRSLPQWRALQRRQRIGSRWSPYCPTFFFEALVRRANEEMRSARWWRYGL